MKKFLIIALLLASAYGSLSATKGCCMGWWWGQRGSNCNFKDGACSNVSGFKADKWDPNCTECR